MESIDPVINPPPPRAQTPVRAHLALYILLLAVVVSVAIARSRRPLVLPDNIPVDEAALSQVQQRINPNTAPWPELARLPGVGESLAKRIIDYREDRIRVGIKTPFHRPEDLQAVKGIGPKLTEKIAPWLEFPSSSQPHR